MIILKINFLVGEDIFNYLVIWGFRGGLGERGIFFWNRIEEEWDKELWEWDWEGGNGLIVKKIKVV